MLLPLDLQTTVQFSSIQDGTYALGKAHKYALHLVSLRSFPNVAFERVPMFVWLTMALSRPFKEDHSFGHAALETW